MNNKTKIEVKDGKVVKQVSPIASIDSDVVSGKQDEVNVNESKIDITESVTMNTTRPDTDIERQNEYGGP